MTEPPHATDRDASIADKQQRLETIIDQLEDGEVSLERAQNLHTEGKTLIDDPDRELSLGDGKIIERT